MGQPKLGIRENIANIKGAHVKEFVEQNFFGENVIVSVCGQVNHDDVVKNVSKAFAGLGKNSNLPVPNQEKPRYTPSTLFMRDDEMTNANVGIFFKAPTWKDPEFFSMFLFRELMGDYRVDKNFQHLNSSLISFLFSWPTV